MHSPVNLTFHGIKQNVPGFSFHVLVNVMKQHTAILFSQCMKLSTRQKHKGSRCITNGLESSGHVTCGVLLFLSVGHKLIKNVIICSSFLGTFWLGGETKFNVTLMEQINRGETYVLFENTEFILSVNTPPTRCSIVIIISHITSVHQYSVPECQGSRSRF